MKTSSMQSKRCDLHHTWLRRETNEIILYYYIYYMEESVLPGTKPLVVFIRHFIRDPSWVFSVWHSCEWHTAHWRHDSRHFYFAEWTWFRVVCCQQASTRRFNLFNKATKKNEFSKKVKNEYKIMNPLAISKFLEGIRRKEFARSVSWKRKQKQSKTIDRPSRLCRIGFKSQSVLFQF